MLLAEQGSDDAELGELRPCARDMPLVAIGRRIARLDRGVGERLRQRVGEHPPVVGVLEVHRPRIAFAMMFFWISLEPPKMESLRLLK